MRRQLELKFSDVRERAQTLLNSPLAEIGGGLLDLLSWSTEAHAQKVVDYASGLLKRLPRAFDQRFYFDAYAIQSITNEWSDGPVGCSEMIVPAYYYGEWGYETIQIPILSEEADHLIDLIYLPRSRENDIPQLLDYPWLIHELGHYLVARHGGELIDLFLPRLEKVLSALMVRSIPDRGVAKSKADETLEAISLRWHLSSNRESWTREIVIDTISLWACGPPYLATFHNHHHDVDHPFIIEQPHPPVDLRTAALVRAAHNLGWQRFAKPLETSMEGWRKKIPSSILNRYISLRSPQLIEAAIDSAFEYCNHVMIPRIKAADLSRINRSLSRNERLSGGIELIVGGWLASKARSEDDYEEWERMTFLKVAEEITP